MRTEYDGRKLKCRYCNYDIYWTCPKCGAYGIELIRFSHRYKLKVHRASN